MESLCLPFFAYGLRNIKGERACLWVMHAWLLFTCELSAHCNFLEPTAAHIIAALVCSVLFYAIESDFQQGDGNGKVKLLEK
jgi:hypothetical protein